MSEQGIDKLDISKGGNVCFHLVADENEDVWHHFTGVGMAYNLLCVRCARNLDDLPNTMRVVSQEQFEDIDGHCEGIVGTPEVLARPSDLAFVHEVVTLEPQLTGSILNIAPRMDGATSQWVAILSSAEVVQIDLTEGTSTKLADIPSPILPLAEKVALHLSPDSQFAAIVNDREARGIVIELATGSITMPLNRGSYHPEQTPFPAAFFKSDERIFLVHGTDWNRLDISDPRTGQLLTDRSPTSYRRGETRPEHYLDYFHGCPVISPNAEWIAEDGWVWHPFGVAKVWSLKRWFTDNVWESEDGESIRRLAERTYHWNAPMCWIDEKTLAVWGHGNDDDCMLPAVQLFDAETGKQLRWFAGPKEGALYFDRYLFSTSKEGTDVWDIETGERLLHDPELVPIGNHPRTHEFLSLTPDRAFRLSQFRE